MCMNNKKVKDLNQLKYSLRALFNPFYVTSPVVNLIPPLHIVSAENAFMVAAGIC